MERIRIKLKKLHQDIQDKGKVESSNSISTSSRKVMEAYQGRGYLVYGGKKKKRRMKCEEGFSYYV